MLLKDVEMILVCLSVSVGTEAETETVEGDKVRNDAAWHQARTKPKPAISITSCSVIQSLLFYNIVYL